MYTKAELAQQWEIFLTDHKAAEKTLDSWRCHLSHSTGQVPANVFLQFLLWKVILSHITQTRSGLVSNQHKQKSYDYFLLFPSKNNKYHHFLSQLSIDVEFKGPHLCTFKMNRQSLEKASFPRLVDFSSVRM